jgi:hypothetical protein
MTNHDLRNYAALALHRRRMPEAWARLADEDADRKADEAEAHPLVQRAFELAAAGLNLSTAWEQAQQEMQP